MSQAVLCRPATGFQQHWGIDLIVQLKNMIDHINIPEDIYDPPLMDDDVERNVGNLFIECLGKCFPAAGNYAEYWQAATRLIQPPLEGGPGVVHMAGGGRKSSRRTRRIQRGGMKRSRNNRSTASGSGSAAGSAPPSPPEAAIGRRGAGGILSAAPSLEGTPSAAAAAAARRYANTLELEEGLALPAPRTRRRRPEGDVLRMIEILQNEINEIKDVLHFYKNIYTLDLRIEFVRNDTVEGKNAKKRIRKNAVISYIQTLFKNLYNRTELPAEGPELEDVVELEEGDLDENTNGLFALDGAATNFALGFSPLWALEQISENCIAHLQQLRSIQPNIVEEIRDDFTILKALSSGDIEEIRPYIDNTVRISDRYIQTSTEFSRSNSRRSFMNSISEATQSWLYVPIFYAIFTDDAAIAANGPIQQKIRLTATFLNRYSAGLWERILASFRARIRPNGIAAYRDMLGVPLRGEYIDADHQDILFESDGLLPLAPDDQALLQQILNNVGRPTAEGVAILQAIDYAIGQEGAALARPLTSGERQAVAAGANLRSARSRGFGVESLGPSAVPLGIPLGSRRAQQMAAAAAAAPLPLAGIAEQNERNEGNNLRRTRKRRGKSTRRKTNR
jgi:hypothetical protein